MRLPRAALSHRIGRRRRRAAGMSRASVYRLRERAGAESFANAWDRVLSPPGSGRAGGVSEDFRKVTDAALIARLESGLIQPVIYRGRMVAIRRKPDDSALLRLLRRTAVGRDHANEGGQEP